MSDGHSATSRRAEESRRLSGDGATEQRGEHDRRRRRRCIRAAASPGPIHRRAPARRRDSRDTRAASRRSARTRGRSPRNAASWRLTSTYPCPARRLRAWAWYQRESGEEPGVRRDLQRVDDASDATRRGPRSPAGHRSGSRRDEPLRHPGCRVRPPSAACATSPTRPALPARTSGTARIAAHPGGRSSTAPGRRRAASGAPR